mgnify:CR=1 FL=1
MNQPEWDPVVVVDKPDCLSGPIPVCAVLSMLCDQVMSPKVLAPYRAAQRPESIGHGLEIPMAFWSALRSMGPSSSSYAWIPMGARCGSNPTPNSRKSGHVEARKTAGTVTRELDEEFISSCLSSIYLTRAFSWAHHNGQGKNEVRTRAHCGARVSRAVRDGENRKSHGTTRICTNSRGRTRTRS